MGDLWGSDVPTAPPVNSAFADGVRDSEQVEIKKPPVAWLAGSCAAVGIAVVLFVLPGSTKHFVGYVLGSFLAIGAMGTFWRVDHQARCSPMYSPRPVFDALSRVALVCAVLASAAHVWFIASELAR